MKELFRYGTIASIFLLTAGPAAFAQTYNPNYGPGSGQGWNSGGWHQGSGSSWNPGSGGGWSQGSGGGQGMEQGSKNVPSQQDAFQELSKYGFNNVRNLQ